MRKRQLGDGLSRYPRHHSSRMSSSTAHAQHQRRRHLLTRFVREDNFPKAEAHNHSQHNDMGIDNYSGNPGAAETCRGRWVVANVRQTYRRKPVTTDSTNLFASIQSNTSSLNSRSPTKSRICYKDVVFAIYNHGSANPQFKPISLGPASSLRHFGIQITGYWRSQIVSLDL